MTGLEEKLLNPLQSTKMKATNYVQKSNRKTILLQGGNCKSQHHDQKLYSRRES